ncbi:MAG TPA: hypothetical protein VNE62_07595 [Actinomycetota bacterium]|nr:hypothetical protein [Actinomycetota bacterium]
MRRSAADIAAAAAVAAVVSGVPSTVYAIATGRPVLEATQAAGSMVLPRETRQAVLVAAAAPLHVALSAFWATVLAASLPRRRPVLWGAVGGTAIAALDLGVIGRRFPRIRALPAGAQIADHVVFGAAVATVLARRSRRR